jgi:hypothetical protein
MQTSSALSSAALPQFIQSLTPLGDGSIKDRDVHHLVHAALSGSAASFTSQDNCANSAAQGQPQLQPRGDSHSDLQRSEPAALNDVDQAMRRHQGDGVSLSEQKKIQQQQSAASALSKYQKFLRQQQQQQMPPPQYNQLIASFQDSNAGDGDVQHSQLQLPAACHQLSESADLPPQQQRHDSSATIAHETLTPLSAANPPTILRPTAPAAPAESPDPSRCGSLLIQSSPMMSLSLSLNTINYPSSPCGGQDAAASSPAASRLPKLRPSADGKAGFIVLPASAHADAAVLGSMVSPAGAVQSTNVVTAQNASRTNQLTFAAQDEAAEENCRMMNVSAERDSCSADTQESAASCERPEETLVIPETPTCTPTHSKTQTRIENCGAALGQRRPDPPPLCEAASTRPSTSSDFDHECPRALSSSGTSKRCVVMNAALIFCLGSIC